MTTSKGAAVTPSPPLRTCNICGADYDSAHPRRVTCGSDACISERRRRAARRHASTRGKRERGDYARRWHLLSRYGITESDYDALLAAQGGACAVCGFMPTDDDARLHVDHDHACCAGDRSCGACIRGLLCQHCNRALGIMRDDPARLRAGADYIERHS